MINVKVLRCFVELKYVIWKYWVFYSDDMFVFLFFRFFEGIYGKICNWFGRLVILDEGI